MPGIADVNPDLLGMVCAAARKSADPVAGMLTTWPDVRRSASVNTLGAASVEVENAMYVGTRFAASVPVATTSMLPLCRKSTPSCPENRSRPNWSPVTTVAGDTSVPRALRKCRRAAAVSFEYCMERIPRGSADDVDFTASSVSGVIVPMPSRPLPVTLISSVPPYPPVRNVKLLLAGPTNNCRSFALSPKPSRFVATGSSYSRNLPPTVEPSDNSLLDSPFGHVRMPPLSPQELSTPCLPAPDDTSSDPVAPKGFAIVSALPAPQPAPAEIRFPLASNFAQSPLFTVPPPNQTLAPSSDHVFVDVHPYKLRPAAASLLKNVSPTEQVNGRLVPVLEGLV